MLTELIRVVTFKTIIIIGIGLLLMACRGRATPAEDIQPMSEIISQSAASPTPLQPTPPPATLPAEIIEPVSPIVPASPLPTPPPEEQTPMPPADSQIRVPPGGEEALKAAIAALAEHTGLLPDQIEVVSIEAVEWRDASLGCPQPGYMYAQVITPGYLIVLQADNQTYEYHTDSKSNVVLCQNNQTEKEP